MIESPRSCIRKITAYFDDNGIAVYQAFDTRIATAATRNQRFGDGFSLNRRSWIKPNLGWMLYRSGYARKYRQERVLRITLRRDGFDEILALAVLNQPEAPIHTVRLQDASVICQWDPFRDLAARKVGTQRAIQLGLKGETLKAYVHDWCLRIDDITDLVHAIEAAVINRQPIPSVPEERLYPVSAHIAQRLGMTQ